MGCESTKYLGKEVALEFYIGCGDTLPTDAQWLPIGSLRKKSTKLKWDTVDGTADDAIGSLKEMLATFKELTFSADGVSKRADGTLSNQTLLYKHFINPVVTNGQPLVWARMTFPDVTLVAFMLISTYDREDPYDGMGTFSLDMSSTASDFGLIVTDTPVV